MGFEPGETQKLREMRKIREKKKSNKKREQFEFK